jgi:hypothetical protein
MRRVALLLVLSFLAAPPARAEAPPPPTAVEPTPPAPTPERRPEPRPIPPLPPVLKSDTPAQLFASVEEAWSAGDSDAFAFLVDTTSVRIGLKPGATPTAAMTRSAAAFLFQDQLRLVTTQSFQVLRMNAGNTSSTATARWIADWGGRQGVRRLTVTLSAVPAGGRWRLREVRVKG